MNKRVVITGVGVISPIGIGAKVFLDALMAGQMGIHRISLFDPSGFKCQIGGEVPEYKIGDYVPKSYRKATKLMARDIELAVIAADGAFKDAGIQSKAYTETPEIDGKRFGCNIGAGLINADLNELTAAMNVAREGDILSLVKWGGEGMQKLTPLWLLKYLPNMLACHVTIVHGLMGPSNTITCQDASSHLAIGEAFRTIQRGKADLAICGGAESRMNLMGQMRQQLLGRLNNDANDTPATALRPFDVEANGTVFAEGGGLFILEEYEHAKKRGVKIYAELLGFAASQDTYSVTEPDPSGHSYGKAVENAIKDAKLSPGDIDLLIPNGLGAPSADAAELAGLKSTFGSELPRVAFAPIKAQIGTCGAGCGVDAAAALLSLDANMIPPSVNTKNLIGDVKLNVSTTAREQKLTTALSSVYSVGGQNAAMVFRKI